MPPLSPEKPALCAGCGGKISDRYYLLAVDKQWHLRCLKCCECKLALESELTCFAKDGSIYCKEDYYRYSRPGPHVRSTWGTCPSPGTRLVSALRLFSAVSSPEPGEGPCARLGAAAPPACAEGGWGSAGSEGECYGATPCARSPSQLLQGTGETQEESARIPVL